MLFQLIKKDIKIVKGYSAGVVAIAIGLPLLLAYKQPQIAGLISLMMAVLISSVAFNLALSEKENQYPKATALLSSTPYMRTKVVYAKYLLYFIIYIICCLASFVEMCFVPQLVVSDCLKAASIVFLIQAIGMGIFLPIQYKFGYEKTKFVCFLLFLSPFAINATEHIAFPANLVDFFKASPIVLPFALYVLGVLVWLVSLAVSQKIFAKKDLL